MLTSLLDLLVPHRCVRCGARSAPPWCRGCARVAAALATDADTSCRTCAGPVGRHTCWTGPAPVSRLDVVYRYHGPVADAVVAGKTRGVRAVWAVLGQQLAARVPRGEIDVVTWVPTAPARRRRRGFDHAELLARSVAAGVERPVAGLLRASPDLVDRGSADAPDRDALPPDAYRSTGRLRGAHVLLVDDVITTGATVLAAANALTSAGAGQVRGAVVARAGAHPLGAAGRPPGRIG